MGISLDQSTIFFPVASTVGAILLIFDDCAHQLTSINLKLLIPFSSKIYALWCRKMKNKIV